MSRRRRRCAPAWTEWYGSGRRRSSAHLPAYQPPQASTGSRATPVQLDVPSAEQPPGLVSVGQPERELVAPPRLAPVGHLRFVGESTLAVHLRRATDPARRGVHFLVPGYTGPLDLGAVAVVIDVSKVTPERTVLDAARDAKVSLGPRGGAGDPAAARDEVPAGGRRRRAA